MKSLIPDSDPELHHPAKRTLGVTGLALLAALALTLGISTPSFAATGAQTGEWDIVATSSSQTPRLQNFNHDAETWDPVLAPSAWFAVGSGKFIDGAGTTAVSGGGFRFENVAAVSKTATFRITIPSNVGLVIRDDITGTAIVNVPAATGVRTATWSTPAVASGDEFHRHYDWTFSGSGTATATNLGVSVSISGGGTSVGNYSANATYRLTF